MSGPVDLVLAAREGGVDPEGPVLVAGASASRSASGSASGSEAPERPTGRPPERLTGRPAGRLTYLTLAGLDRAVDERAGKLEGSVAAGRIHPVVLEPDREGVLTLLALWRLGVTPAPLNPGLTAPEEAEARKALEGRAADGAQVVLWTSGTSGTPRGVALAYGALAAHVDAVVERLELDPARDAWLATLSPAHVGGFMLLFRALLTGSPLLALGALSPARIAEVLDRGPKVPERPVPVTHLSLVPTQLLRLLEARKDAPPPPELRCLLLGGAHTPRGLLERALAGGWPAALTWGMTEMASQVATAPPARVRTKPGTVGPPLEGVSVRVAQDGELLVRGPAAASAYLDGQPLLDDDGWYATGDLGRMDEDGDLWITGRRSDRIVSGGVTVDAAEVEEALRAHPTVVEACVVGLPDPEWGERVAAWVVPVEGEWSLEELERWLRERLGAAKRPRRWVVADHLPRNANGKVDRVRVRERLSRERDPGPSDPAPSDPGPS